MGTAELQNLAVTGGKIATDAVNDGHIAAGEVASSELGTSAVGAEELAGYSIVSPEKSVVAGGTDFITATCPAGMQVVSGGAWWDFQSGRLSASHEDPDTNGWRAAGQNQGGVAQDLNVEVFCLSFGI